MAEGLAPSTLDLLWASYNMLKGLRRLLLDAATPLAAAEAGDASAEDEDAPEEGAALLGSRLRCIVHDRLDPALADLDSLIAETSPEAP